MSEIHYPGAMELAMANATRERKKPVPFPTETESKMVQLVSRAERAEACAATQERERILEKFLSRALTSNYEPGEIVLAQWDGTSLRCLTEPGEIREALS